jgi:hypothetical protein
MLAIWVMAEDCDSDWDLLIHRETFWSCCLEVGGDVRRIRRALVRNTHHFD